MATNITEAIAEAKRLSRAEEIINAGYVFSQDADTGTVFVSKPGKLSFEYTIGEQLTGRDGCSCPDHQRTGNPCKHEYAWSLIQAEEAAQVEAMEFRAEEEANADF